MMLMTRDTEKAAIQNVQADTSVVNSTFRRPSVQKYFQALINYNRFFLSDSSRWFLHILPYLPSHKHFPLNLSQVLLMHCPLQEY